MRSMHLRGFYRGAGRASALLLITANAVPVFGILFLGWSTAALLLLFWTENVIVGVMNVVKLLTVRAGPERSPFLKWSRRIFLSAFFTIHYGAFCAGHALGVLLLIGIGLHIEGVEDMPEYLADLIFKERLIYAAAALFVSHLVSLFSNWFIGKERERPGKTWEGLMKAPYSRVIVLHITIILGAVPMLFTGSPAGGLMLLVALKTAVDLKAHLQEREKMAPAPDRQGEVRS